VQLPVMRGSLRQLWRACSSHSNYIQRRLSANGYSSVELAQSWIVETENAVKLNLAGSPAWSVGMARGLVRFSSKHSEALSTRRSSSPQWIPLPHIHEHYPGYSISIVVWTALNSPPSEVSQSCTVGPQFSTSLSQTYPVDSGSRITTAHELVPTQSRITFHLGSDSDLR